MAGTHAKLTVAERRRLAREQAASAAQSGPPSSYPISKLAANPANRRESLEEIEGLVETVERDGFLQSFGVIPVAVYVTAYPEFATLESIQAADYVVVNGNRRLEAARIAGVDDVPILVNTTATTRREIARVSLVENVQRLSFKPIEEAEAVEELVREFGTAAALAKEIGKSEGWISQRRRLLNLAPEFRDAVRLGELRIEEARNLGKLKDHDAQRTLWQEMQESDASDNEAEIESKPQADAAKRRLPAQAMGKPAEREVDPSAQRRRDACATAVELVAALDDFSHITGAALLLSGPRKAAEALAGTWLPASRPSRSPDDFATVLHSNDAADRRQAVLALALALCELHTADTSRPRDSIDGLYINWLVSHCDYKPSSDEQLHLKTFTA